MKRFFASLFRFLLRWPNQKTNLLPPYSPNQPILDGLTTAVYIREPNGSRTKLEHYVEQELINRGARVVLANPKAGYGILKESSFKPLAEGTHFSFVGSLVVMKNVFMEVEDEDEELQDVPAVQYQLAFRLIGKDGAILASGTSENAEEADLITHEGVLRKIAAEAVAYLDQANVWSHIIVG